jgi:hypothetical protein
VSTRFLIGPGFALVGIGLLLMRGLTPDSDWTHLIPGLAIAGIGAGFINVPLASTAVAVVEPARAGMASGVNATFRQVGVATGIAALGSLFATTLHDDVVDRLSGGPLADRAETIADALSTGRGSNSFAGLPGQGRALVEQAAAHGFVDGLNTILLIGAVVAFAASGLTLALIRQRDLVNQGEAEALVPA